jgi:signal transduction histidine kinase
MSRGQTSQGQAVDVGVALDAVVRLVAPTARAHDVAIDVEATGGPGSLQVRADESDLQQALINLLLNAVQASAGGGTVRLRVTAGDAVRILIADQGVGIAPDMQARIFEPFFSLRDGGTGLGLFVSLNSVRKWGGDIHVVSAAGAGATFEVVLPALVGAVPRHAVGA